MFYSHEILTSHQYGVATVWLISTGGLKSVGRKISRKAIQDVNVQKACETILKPGAPIALRLQGSLLYGISRVYAEQCSYVLGDAEKTREHMHSFYRALQLADSHSLDPETAMSKRHQLILHDDPAFEVDFTFPDLNLNDNEGGGDARGGASQASRKASSQLSPFGGSSQLSSHSMLTLGGLDLGGLDLSDIGPAPPGTQLESVFGGSHHGDNDGTMFMMSGAKGPGGGGGAGHGFASVLGREDATNVGIAGDLGFEIDEDGNFIMADADGTDLPDLPRPTKLLTTAGGQPQQDLAVQPGLIRHVGDDDAGLVFDGGGDAPMMNSGGGGIAQPQGQPAAEGQDQNLQPQPEESELQMGQAGDQEHEQSSQQVSSAATAVEQRQRRRRVLVPDRRQEIPRGELDRLNREWASNVEAERRTGYWNEQSNRGLRGTVLARKNGFAVTFGLPLGGSATGPTALDAFFSLREPWGLGLSSDDAHGMSQDEDQGRATGQRRGRRRKSGEALGEEAEDSVESERRVRPRLSEEDDGRRDERGQQSGQGGGQILYEDDGGMLILSDDKAGQQQQQQPEAGRDSLGGGGLADIHSDLPWNRPSFVVHGSSAVKRAGAGSRHVSPSPLLHRAGGPRRLSEIERFSDHGPGHGSDLGFGGVGFGSGMPSSDPARGASAELIPGAAALFRDASQVMRDALDLDGRNFLGFLGAAARDRGELREVTDKDDGEDDHGDDAADDNGNRRYAQWVEFDGLFGEERDRKRAVVAQAFLNVLTLATKRAVRVEQDGQNATPFGAIRIGVPLLATGEDEDADEDDVDDDDDDDDNNNDDDSMAEQEGAAGPSH